MPLPEAQNVPINEPFEIGPVRWYRPGRAAMVLSFTDINQEIHKLAAKFKPNETNSRAITHNPGREPVQMYDLEPFEQVFYQWQTTQRARINGFFYSVADNPIDVRMDLLFQDRADANGRWPLRISPGITHIQIKVNR